MRRPLPKSPLRRRCRRATACRSCWSKRWKRPARRRHRRLRRPRCCRRKSATHSRASTRSIRACRTRKARQPHRLSAARLDRLSRRSSGELPLPSARCRRRQHRLVADVRELGAAAKTPSPTRSSPRSRPPCCNPMASSARAIAPSRLRRTKRSALSLRPAGGRRAALAAAHRVRSRARSCLERLTALDPSFAVGFSFLAVLYTREHHSDIAARPGDLLPLDRRSARGAARRRAQSSELARLCGPDGDAVCARRRRRKLSPPATRHWRSIPTTR